MSIDSNVVKKIAKLARLKVEDTELSHFTNELNSILAWIEQLQEVNTDNIKPLHSVTQTPLFMRKDVVNDGNIQQEVLANAPGTKYGCFAVPKVVE